MPTNNLGPCDCCNSNPVATDCCASTPQRFTVTIVIEDWGTDNELNGCGCSEPETIEVPVLYSATGWEAQPSILWNTATDPNGVILYTALACGPLAVGVHIYCEGGAWRVRLDILGAFHGYFDTEPDPADPSYQCGITYDELTGVTATCSPDPFAIHWRIERASDHFYADVYVVEG
jgi:hypothetical protein